LIESWSILVVVLDKVVGATIVLNDVVTAAGVLDKVVGTAVMLVGGCSSSPS
jgi:hypothetical protein